MSIAVRSGASDAGSEFSAASAGSSLLGSGYHDPATLQRVISEHDAAIARLNRDIAELNAKRALRERTTATQRLDDEAAAVGLFGGGDEAGDTEPETETETATEPDSAGVSTGGSSAGGSRRGGGAGGGRGDAKQRSGDDPVEVAWRVVDAQKQRAAAAVEAEAEGEADDGAEEEDDEDDAAAAEAAAAAAENEEDDDDQPPPFDPRDHEPAEAKARAAGATAASAAAAVAAAAAPLDLTEEQLVPYCAWFLVLFCRLRSGKEITDREHTRLKLHLLDRHPPLFAALSEHLRTKNRDVLVETVLALITEPFDNAPARS